MATSLLVAASHQFPGELFPFLGREKELVASLHDLVQSIYSELMPTATYDSAVIDIEVSDDPYLGLTSQLVEFNPYGKLGSSSPALFDWIDDADLLYPAEGAAASGTRDAPVAAAARGDHTEPARQLQDGATRSRGDSSRCRNATRGGIGSAESAQSSNPRAHE